MRNRSKPDTPFRFTFAWAMGIAAIATFVIWWTDDGFQDQKRQFEYRQEVCATPERDSNLTCW